MLEQKRRTPVDFLLKKKRPWANFTVAWTQQISKYGHENLKDFV